MPKIESTIAINDAFSGPLNKLSSGLQRSQSAISKLKSALSGGSTFGEAAGKSQSMFKSMTGGVVVGNLISKGMGLASQGIHSMIGELNEASTSWQTFEGNMHQIGRSPAQIAAAKKDMQKFAQQTIYSASDMSSTYSQLAAVGIKNTGQLVKGFGGLAAAADNPQQAMKTLSEQATQMAAKPKAQWMDFKLMLEQSPAGMAAVAKTMGTNLTGLIQKIQGGEVSSKRLLNAIAKTGTNANFSKMATQYKTVGQAMDGLKETLANGLQPAFDKVGKVGIKVISDITDSLGNINFEELGDKLASGLENTVNFVKPIIQNLGVGFQQMFAGFKSTGALTAVANAFVSIGNAAGQAVSAMNSSSGGNSLFTQIGKISGTAITTVANAISGIAKVMGNFDPSSLKILAAAFVALKFGVKGLVLTGVVTALSQLNNVDPSTLQAIAKGITVLSAAFAAFHIGGEIVSGITNVVTNVQGAFSALQELGTGISMIFSGISVGPLLAVIGSVTAIIIGAVMAWQDNFMGFRDVITGIFSNIGSIFQPLISAFQNLGQVLQPVISTVGPALKGIFEGVSAAVVLGIALAIGVFADALTSVINVAVAFGSAVKVIAQSLHAVGDALTGNFAGAKRDIEDAANAVGTLKQSLSGIGTHANTSNIMGQFSKIKFGAQSTANAVNNTKMSPQVDVASANAKLASLGNKSIPAPKVEQPKLNFSNPFQSLITQSQSTKLPAPKVGTPTVPTPKMPAQAQKIAAPKVGTPTVPTPKLPTTVQRIPAPKVGTPVVPQPKMPTITQTIPAPKVGTPNMSGVVSAVSNGMARAAAAARAGGAALSSAVRGAVMQAVGAARSAAGAMTSAGAMIGAGLAAGMRSQIGAVAAAANALVAQADRAARAKAQIHSPSRLFAEVGDYIGQGLALGMNGTQSLVSSAGTNLIDSAYNDGFNSSFALTPTGNRPGGAIAPSSLNTNTATTSNSRSTVVNIQPGAIVMNSTGNNRQDAKNLLEELEILLQEQEDKSLI